MLTIVIFVVCWSTGSILVGVLLRRWITRLVGTPGRQRQSRKLASDAVQGGAVHSRVGL